MNTETTDPEELQAGDKTIIMNTPSLSYAYPSRKIDLTTNTQSII